MFTRLNSKHFKDTVSVKGPAPGPEIISDSLWASVASPDRLIFCESV